METQNIEDTDCGTRYAYVRVSTKSQKEDRQLLALKNHCDVVMIEKVSATAKSRPVFAALMKKLKSNDTFVILDLDRAFRSTVEAIQTAEMLRERGVNFKILSANIDTSSEFGEIIFSILASLAQFERRIIVRRTKEGLDAARERGVKLGRPYALTEREIRRAHRIVQQQHIPVYKVAKCFSVAHSTLNSGFERLGLAT